MSYLKDDKGQGSYTRLSGFILILAYVVWGSYLVYLKNTIPDIPLVIAGLITAMYGINKTTSSLSINPTYITKLKELYDNLVTKKDSSNALDK